MQNSLINDFYQLKVKQLMDNRIWDLPLLEENDDILIVLNILGGRNHIWVVNNKKEKKLVGVITEHDILTTLSPKNFDSNVFSLQDFKPIQDVTVKIAKDIMSKKVITCEKEEKIFDVLNLMKKYQLRRIPVVINKQIIGEITLHQLIRKYYGVTQYYPITEEG
jgi:predicted transcriptional regulator